MTHFPPSIRSEHAMYAGDPLNPYFINNIPDDELKEFGAKLWVHGHVHSKFSYKIGDMQVECNPLGYPKENYSRVEDYPVVLVDI